MPPATQCPAPAGNATESRRSERHLLPHPAAWIPQGHIQAYRFGPRLLQVDLNELDKLRVPVDRPAQRRAS